MAFVSPTSSQYCKVLSVTWLPNAEEREKCCDMHEGYGKSFCYQTCVLCCDKVIIQLGPCDKKDKTPEYATDARDYPVYSPAANGNGISFTVSTYGSSLPIVFGSDKLTGNVFWASPVRDVLIDNGASFYQTVDFALGLCEGVINGILRMWLGEKLILDRSADVDANGVAQPSATGWIAGASIDLTDADSPLRNSLSDSSRLTKLDIYVGNETQLPDPTIVAAEGYDFTPAYRGTSYIVFRNFIIGQSTIPSIFVELVSNTESPYPRLYGTYQTPIVKFDKPITGTTSLLADLSYDVAHVPSFDSTGTATPPNGKGFARFNNNTLALENEFEIDTTLSIAPHYEFSRLLPQSGNIILHDQVGNAGTLYVINPYANVLLSTFGPGGGISDHSLTTGLSALETSITFPAISAGAFGQIDVFMGIGNFNKSIGFVEVDQNGQMKFVQNLSNVMTHRISRAVFLPISDSFTTQHATFPDGTTTPGRWVFVFNYDNGNTTEFKIGRMKVGDSYGNSLLGSVVYSEPYTLLCDQLKGEGIVHEISHVMADPSDNCLIIFFICSEGDPLVAKFNPFTNQIVWKADAIGYGTTSGTDRAYLVDNKYAWVTLTGQIRQIDLNTGVTTLIESQVGNVDLPLPNVFEQFYNGVEQSIIYLTNTSGRRVVKVFLEKLTRSTVELGDIVQNLLSRVGLLNTDMDIADVDALTLRGYTISQRQSLRTSFAELAQAFKYDVVESNGKIKYLTRGKSSSVTIPKKWFGSVSNEDGWMNAKDENDISRIRKISLTYRDINRDYKNNVQSILLPNTSSQTFDNDAAIDVTVPIVLDSSTAKLLAEILLYGKLVYDTTYEAIIPERYANLDPGDVITVQPDTNPAHDFQMRIRKTSFGADKVVKIEASREDPDIYNDVVSLFGGAGRYIASAFKPLPPRIDCIALDIPCRSNAEAAAADTYYRLFFAFLNQRPATPPNRDIGITINGVESYTVQPPTNFPTWGYVVTPPVARSSHFSTDNVSQLRIKMVSTEGATIASATHDDLLASDTVNLCWVGGELLQFTTVLDEGNGYYTFTGLHRAKFNTSINFGTQVVGTKFILLGNNLGILDDGSIRYIDVPADKDPAMLAQVFLQTTNPFQDRPMIRTRALNLTPWTVASLEGAYNGGGDLVVSWQRRTRFNGEYPDSGDETAPVNEIDESYVIYVYLSDATFDTGNASTYLRRVEVTTPSFTYTAAMQAEDGFNRTTTDIIVAVYQQGSVSERRYGTTSKLTVPPVA